MQSIIQTSAYPIFFDEKGYENLIQKCIEKKYSKIFILCDDNTNEHCVPLLLEMLPFEVEIIEIQAGEEHKNLDTCMGVWQTLSEEGADRKSLLINIGGGVVTDLGGFVASTYMRGIDFINIPTSLLAMVDASVGGKTGVDLGFLKNQIGVINTPTMLLIDTLFLQTLPSEQLRSGLCEMFKHGLISDAKYWQKLCHLSQFDMADLQSLIYESVVIKNDIVTQDPTEKALRKTLNFGHTLGHAIESFCLENPQRKTLLHGEAIAIGIVLAAFLSVQQVDFPQHKCEEIKMILAQYFPKVSFSHTEIEKIISLLKFDKKNAYGDILFVLLEDIGRPILDCKIPTELIFKAFEYYQK